MENVHVHPHPQTEAVLKRLARIEGHVRAVRQMAEEGRGCADILHQIGAVEAALRRVAGLVLEDHLERCIIGAARETERRVLVEELKGALLSYLR